jgi:aminomethyltransferase
MGYVATAQSALGTPLQLMVRGTPRPARIVPLPFVPHRYHRG